MKTSRFFITLALLVSSQLAEAQSPLQNLNVTGAVDLLHPVSIEDNQADQNKLNIRAAEFAVYGPIDHLFDGVLNFAGHNEAGEFEWAVHEAYVGSSKLIPRSRFKIGKFFLGVGRLNQYHQHDWPFVSAPKVQREFFNRGRPGPAFEAEGAIDAGGEVSVLLPLPFFLDLTVGVTNGYCFGHCHEEANRPQTPLAYIRPVTFFDLGDGSGVQVGLNFLTRRDFEGEETMLTGVDATYKLREGKRLKWLVQSELWHRSLNNPAGGSSTLGAYLYPQYGFEDGLSFGIRLDAFSQLNRSFATTGEKQKDLDYAFVPTLTYKPSEFSTVRLAYSHEADTTQGDADVLDRRFEVQFVYVLGAHPAHDF